MLLTFLTVPPVIGALTFNLALNNTKLGEGFHFESRLSPVRMAWITVSNLIAVLFTLGLLYPWARIRITRYRASCITFIGSADIGDLRRRRGQQWKRDGRGSRQLLRYRFRPLSCPVFISRTGSARFIEAVAQMSPDGKSLRDYCERHPADIDRRCARSRYRHGWAHVSRKLEFPDGGLFETSDNDGVDALLKGSSGILAWMERSWRLTSGLHW